METPVAFLQTVGHPVRWQLIEALGQGDRTVAELTALVGEPQNLVSYHLAKLRKADLVSTRRSSADGRDNYYAVDLARIEAGLARASASAVGERTPLRRVLFLCTGNSARSQMAEALLKIRSGGAVEACSAGSDPKALHPLAVRVMRDGYGIDISENRTKRLDEFARRKFDRVITLCDRVREVCPDFGSATRTHWSMPDPSAGKATYAAFKATAAELDRRISYLLREENR